MSRPNAKDAVAYYAKFMAGENLLPASLWEIDESMQVALCEAFNRGEAAIVEFRPRTATTSAYVVLRRYKQ